MTAPGTPRVSFVVPCYNLGHLLGQCLDSILAQTFRDFEVLVMDDCSPDDTPAVARARPDPRVRHIRHPRNLGNIRNYNAGIGLARGEFVWLISADDRLRVPHVLQRYVEALDRHPRAGFVFCPAVGLQDGAETGVIAGWDHGRQDRVFPGRRFLRRLAWNNCVSAPSGMVRRSCYARISLFPDMPYAGDWYLWSVFALHHDVAYLAEPMVNYRLHGSNLTKILRRQDPRILAEDDLRVRWEIAAAARRRGYREIAEAHLDRLAAWYAAALEAPGAAFAPEEFARSLARFAPAPAAAADMRWRVDLALGNHAYARGDLPGARRRYRSAIRLAPHRPGAWLRYLGLSLGAPGAAARRALAALRDRFARAETPSSRAAAARAPAASAGGA